MTVNQVYANRDEIPENTVSLQKLDICLSRVEYYSLITSLGIILLILIASSFVAGLCFRFFLMAPILLFVGFKIFRFLAVDVTVCYTSKMLEQMQQHHTLCWVITRTVNSGNATCFIIHLQLGILLLLIVLLTYGMYFSGKANSTSNYVNFLCIYSTPPESTVGDRQTELDFGEGEVADRAVSRKGQHKQQSRAFQDPSEPIYTEPSLFERSRSLRSVAASDLRRVVHRTTAEQPAIKEVPDTESAAL